MKHYTREELELYRNGQMSVLGRITCTSHLRECENCKKILEELKEDDRLIAELRSSVQIYQELSQEEPLKTN
jgi:predicted anti-sigma-YlaC factor YlaD